MDDKQRARRAKLMEKLKKFLEDGDAKTLQMKLSPEDLQGLQQGPDSGKGPMEQLEQKADRDPNGGIDVGEAMIKGGHAKPYNPKLNPSNKPTSGPEIQSLTDEFVDNRPVLNPKKLSKFLSDSNRESNKAEAEGEYELDPTEYNSYLSESGRKKEMALPVEQFDKEYSTDAGVRQKMFGKTDRVPQSEEDEPTEEELLMLMQQLGE